MNAHTSNVSIKYLIGLIIIYPLLFVWQGLDFTDTGFWLTGYRIFLSHPESIGSGIANWGSYAIGWLVSFFTADLGILGFKFADAIVCWATLFISYLLLNDVNDKKDKHLILILLFTTLLYATKTIGNWIGYNNLTGLTYIAGGALLYFGLQRSSVTKICISGLITGAGIFIRFPNLLGIGLVSAVVLYGWAERQKLSKIAVNAISFTAGYVAAIISAILLMKVMGHYEYYAKSLSAVSNMAASSDSHHSSGHLIKFFIEDHIMAFGIALEAFGIAFFYTRIACLLSKKWQILFLLLGMIAAVIILPVMGCWKWIVTGFCYILLLVAVFDNFRSNNKIMLLAFVAGLILMFAPLGSSNGIRNATYGSWLALPLTLLIINNTKQVSMGRFSLNRDEVAYLFTLIILSLCAFSITAKMSYTYRDSKNRLLMTSTVDHPLLKGVHTTSARAAVVQEVLDALALHVQPGEPLLAYNEIALIHYITGTVPWLGTPWPMLNPPKLTEALLKEKENSKEKLPLIVRARGNTAKNTWPLGDISYDNFNQEDKSRAVFSHFEKRNGYEIIWANDFFEILQVK